MITRRGFLVSAFGTACLGLRADTSKLEEGLRKIVENEKRISAGFDRIEVQGRRLASVIRGAALRAKWDRAAEAEYARGAAAELIPEPS